MPEYRRNYILERGLEVDENCVNAKPFRPQTDYYCEEVDSIDEQICGLEFLHRVIGTNSQRSGCKESSFLCLTIDTESSPSHGET